MKGLLLKEFYNLRISMSVNFVIMIFVAIMYAFTLSDVGGAVQGEEEVGQGMLQLAKITQFIPLAYISGVYSSIMIAASYQADEKARWTPFILGCGVSRGKIIVSKMIVSLFSSFVYLLILLVVLAINFNNLGDDLTSRINVLVSLPLLALAGSFISASVIMVICQRFSAQIAVAIGTFLSMILSCIPLAGVVSLVIPETEAYFLPISIGIFVVFGLIIPALFIYLAKLAFNKKEY